MNIKKRLKKLEAKTETGEEFCKCFPRYGETWQQTLTDDGMAYTEPVLMSEPQPEACDKCAKPRIIDRIIICFGDPENPVQSHPQGAVN